MPRTPLNRVQYGATTHYFSTKGTRLWVWIWPGEVSSIATLLGGVMILGAVIWLVLGWQDDPTIAPSSRVAALSDG